MSQHPDTKDYILILQDNFCEKCYEKYTNVQHKWCKPCQTNYLKNNFANWTSGNEQIDNFIQEMQLEYYPDAHTVFEWIPYDQFNGIKEIDNSGFATIYSAISLLKPPISRF